jgi:hypothetical protein
VNKLVNEVDIFHLVIVDCMLEVKKGNCNQMKTKEVCKNMMVTSSVMNLIMVN